MNAYDIAKDLDREGKFPGHVCYGTSPLLVRAANKLRKQADRIADLETALAFTKRKPLSDEEINKLIVNKVTDYELCRAIEERHGIK